MPTVNRDTSRPNSTFFMGCAGLIALYFPVSVIVHTIVLPEPSIPSTLAPRSGTVITNPRAGERIDISRDRFETNGSLVEIEVTLRPGGAVPLAHLHQHTREQFIGLTGTTVLDVNGTTHRLSPGQSLVVEPRIPHVPSNPSDETVRFRVIMTPPNNLDICLTQVHALLADDSRSNAWLGRTLQLMRFADAYDTYLAGPPLLLQRIGLWLTTPTLRMLGYERFIPKTQPREVRPP